MKIGMNMLLWTGHVTHEHQPVLTELKNKGFDGVQIPILEGDIRHYKRLGVMLDDLNLQRTTLTIIPNLEQNPLSDNPAYRQNALDYLKWCLDCTSALGADQLCGPIYQTLGHFSGCGPTYKEIERAIECHTAIGDHAQSLGLTVAIEAINRFECYFVNTMEDLCNYLDKVNHPRIFGMYDSFHANLEEKNMFSCINTFQDYIKHIHISENDRGTPGRGHIEWMRLFSELKLSGYDGWLTIEAFSRSIPKLAAATRVWRDYFPSKDVVWQEGYSLIRNGWDSI